MYNFTTYTAKPTIRKRLNKLFRKSKNTEVVKLGTSITTVTKVYKNKQVIEVTTNCDRRFKSKI